MVRVIFLDIDGVLHPLERHLPKLVDKGDLFARNDEESMNSLKPGYKHRLLHGELMKENVECLQALVETTKKTQNEEISIVLTSTWRTQVHLRKAILEGLRDRTKDTCAGSRWVDCTIAENGTKSDYPELQGTIFCDCTPYLGGGHSRSEEIGWWLSKNDVDSFVILDDMDVHEGKRGSAGESNLEELKPLLDRRFVKTDPDVGLTKDDVEKAATIVEKNLSSEDKQLCKNFQCAI